MTLKIIKGVFIGSDTCAADGHVAKSNAPGLEMCRVLIAAGYDAHRPLHIYRGDEVAMKISSIGWGAKYTVREDTKRGPELVKYKPRPFEKGVPPAARAS